jgi:dTDP-4-dehydrorhamnose reductase
MNIVVLGKGLLGSHISKLYPNIPVLSHAECDITSPFDIHAILTHYKPDVLINCAGVVPKSSQAHDTMQLFRTNSQGPHLLQAACDEFNCQLIQISTDCVFSGAVGGYCEIDIPKPDTMYGMSKYLGEITEYPHLTIRTSFVGYPDINMRGLLGWASTQKEIVGYDLYQWNGLTTTEFARILIEEIVPRHLSNTIHVYGKETTNKYQMLVDAKNVFGWDYSITRESEIVSEDNKHIKNMTLTSEIPDFCSDKPFVQMLEEMKELWKS